MRIGRRIVLGAALAVLTLVASACGSGGDDESPGGGDTGSAETIASRLTLGGPPECPERPFCIIGLRDVYGVEFGSFKPLDVGGPLTVAALDSGEIDVGLLFSTSSVISANGWVVLEDDQQLQQADNLVPVIREDVVNDEIDGTAERGQCRTHERQHHVPQCARRDRPGGSGRRRGIVLAGRRAASGRR